MVRFVLLSAVSGLLIVACAPKEASPAAVAADVELSTAAAAQPATPAPETRIGAMQLRCGGEDMRVAFEEARAVIVNPDGTSTELDRLDPQPGAPANVATYTNGAMTFTREGGPDTPTVIRFARGRMAFQDCAIAQN